MPTKLTDYIAALPADEQAEIAAETERLVREEKAIRDIRRELMLSQE